jgi:hypothetical protein
MKLTRWILFAGVAALAACSSPTLSTPQSSPDDTAKTDHGHAFGGYVVPLLQPVVSGADTG